MAQKVVFITTTTAGAFTVPSDFGSLVSVEAIGGGAGGKTGIPNGSGGGAYAKSTSVAGLAAGGTAYYSVGSGGNQGKPGTNGGDTWFNAISNAAPTLATQGVLAKGGVAGNGTGTGQGGAAASCVGDLAYSGGDGALAPQSGGGGGGAAGPGGAGGAGGLDQGSPNNGGGGGGGGASLTGPGSAGGVGTTTVGGNGGNGGGGTGGATGAKQSGSVPATTATAGTGGGGGGGFASLAGSGGATGSYWTSTNLWTGSTLSTSVATAGSGGGSGGAYNAAIPAGALYGGGGGGTNNGGTAGTGGQGIIVFTYTQAQKTVFITTTGTSSFPIPTDFVSFISVEAIGAGGGPNSGRGGGGAGGYSKSTSVTGLTAGGLAYYRVGVGGGTTGTNGTARSWFSTSNAEPGSVSAGCLAEGGATQSGSTGGAGGSSTATGVVGDLKYSGGTGGAGGASGGGGGGGAAGPTGDGKNGGAGSTNGAGGGGGANGGSSTAGTNATSGTGGAGGNGRLGTGAGTSGGGAATAGTGAGGGGGSGTNGTGGAGASDLVTFTQTSDGATAGPGGGGGGPSGSQNQGGSGALYGGGGSGGNGSANGGSGAQGIVVFTYAYNAAAYITPSYDVTTGFQTFDRNTNIKEDLGSRYITKNYLLDVYPNIASGAGNRVAPGLFAWGDNLYGALGISSTGNYYSSPVQVGSLTNWKQVSINSGYLTSPFAGVGIKTDGTMWSWGWNAVNTGLLGQNVGASTIYYSSPVQIGALTTWKSVSCGPYKTHAIKTDGTLWAWGSNSRGILGVNNTASYYSSPVQVGALTNWKQVGINACNVNNDFSLALRNDGALFAWGDNRFGELGLGYAGPTLATGGYYSSPIQVGALTNWKQVAGGGNGLPAVGGGYYSLAVKTDGTLWGWGSNNFGQLGLGYSGGTAATGGYYSSPVQVGTLTNWKFVTMNSYQSSYAIKTDGTMWSWGDNTYGQLGNGTTTSVSSPVQVGSLTNWKFIYASPGSQGASCLAIKTDGTLWAWGNGISGQLGINNTTYYSSPVQVGSLTTWKSVVAVDGSALAIQDGYI